MSSIRWSIDEANAEAIIGRAMSLFSIEDNRKKDLELIVTTIQRTGLQGPMDLMGLPEYLGQGSQFVVFKDTLLQTASVSFTLEEVAVKQAMFYLNDDENLDLADKQARRKLHDIYLEIVAMTVPKLRRHPNIARLIGWGVSPRSFHAIPLLIMRLAHSNLAELLRQNPDRFLYTHKLSMCDDVGAGLDAIHQCGLVHGDLKPENVLVFFESNRFVAKLADFGLSVQETDKQEHIRLDGTPGWSAPEVEAGKSLNADQLFQTDTYSFGLLIWSVIFHSGEIPPRSEVLQTVHQDFETSIAKNEFDSGDLVYAKVKQMLQTDPGMRPVRLSPLLQSKLKELSPRPRPHVVTTRPAPHQNFRYFPWELQPLPLTFLPGLRNRVLENADNLPADMLFVIFMTDTAPSRAYVQPPEPDISFESKQPALQALLKAAAKGQPSARAILSAAYRYFGVPLPLEMNTTLKEWLLKSLSKGHPNIQQQLDPSGRIQIAKAMDYFRGHGGYNRYYQSLIRSEWTIRASKLPWSGEDQNSHLHFLATRGTSKELQDYLNKNDADIDAMSGQLETPLYLTCVRGEWVLAQTLLQHGAKPSVLCTIFGVSCLHWLFAMREDLQAEAAIVLLEQGAEINVKAIEPMPFPFYPFLLPAGSPLHWAVVTQNRTAIKLLVDQGANLLLRDCSDPYRYDDRVRILDKFGGIRGEGFSISSQATLGLSPLDYAAMNHDPIIFELLLSMGHDVDVNDTDEEGFTPLHRLSASVIRRTRMGTIFSTRPCYGTRDERRTALRSTVKAIVALGGNLEQLTTGSALKTTESQSNWEYPRFTPLMLAVKNGSVDVAQALLEAGADVNAKADLGRTAFHCLPDDKDLPLECAQMLYRFGADINAVDENGGSPVMAAAYLGALSTVKFLLSRGADIDSRTSNPKAVRRGESIFSKLSSTKSRRLMPGDHPRDEADKAIADMLKQYVFTCPDSAKRERVLNVGRQGATTLLFAFSTNGLTRCVQALLDDGVADHAVNLCYEWETRPDGSRVRVDIFETAMQGTVKRKQQDEARMMQERCWCPQTYDEICRRYDQVISLLRSKSALLEGSDGSVKL